MEIGVSTKALLNGNFGCDSRYAPNLSASTALWSEKRHDLLALMACNAYNECMQYTIRNVPDYLDAALRGAARQQGKSLNEVTIEVLTRGAGLSERRCRQRDLHDIAGSWRKDADFDSALAAQDTIDEEMWR